MRPGKSFDVNGKWFRWTQYEILNGVVTAAEGAQEEEYDPWQDFRKNESKHRTVEQPYGPFLRLRDGLTALEQKGILPSKVSDSFENPSRGPQSDADQLILDWCHRNGHLGLLPVLSDSIFIPSPMHPPIVGSTWLHAVHHRRIGGVWRMSSLSWDGARTSDVSDIMQPRRDGFSWLVAPGDMYIHRPLKELREYFPKRDDCFSYLPPPTLPTFRQFYGEPCAQISEWCKFFGSAVESISAWKGGTRTSLSDRSVLDLHDALHGLAQVVAPTFVFNPDRNTEDEVRISPGLLASYALMFLWDRMENRRAVRCQNCNRQFISDEPRAGYCSQRCRNTAQSRRYRAKRR